MAAVKRVSVGTLFRSAGYAGLGGLWLNLSRIFLSPIILSYIGVEGYGVWALLFSVMATVNFVDASFGFAYAKFTAECDARQAYRELSQLLGAGVRIVGGVALVVLSVLFVVREQALRALSVPEEMLPQASTALLFVMATVFLQMSVGNIAQILNGLQRGDLRAKGQMVASTLYFALGIGLLSIGWGLVALAVAYAFGQFVAVLLGWYWARQLCPELSIALFDVPREARQRVLALGMKFQMIHFANLASGPGFRMLISALLGPVELAMYELARKLVNLGQLAMRSVLSPMMPAFANLQARNRAARVEELIQTGSRIICTLSWISFGFLWIFADQVILLWTGDSYPQATWTLRFLMVGMAFQLFTGMGTANLRALGTIRLEILWNGGATVLLLIFCGPLYHLWGYEGLVAARVLGIMLAAVWFMLAFAREQQFQLFALVRESLVRPSLVLMPVVVAFWWLHLHLPLPAFDDGRWAQAVQLIGWGTVMGLVCTGATWAALLSADERRMVLNTVRRQLARGTAS